MNNDLERSIKDLLTNDAKRMFPDGSQPLGLSEVPAHQRWRRWMTPLAVAASVAAVAGSALWIGGAIRPDPGVPPASSQVTTVPAADPACDFTEREPDPAATVTFDQPSTDGDPSTRWTVTTVDTADSRIFCARISTAELELNVSATGASNMVLQSASSVTIDGHRYIWGIVTPAAVRVTATGLGGVTSWTAVDLHAMATALGVFVAPIPEGAEYTVTAFDSNDEIFGEIVIK